MKKDQTVESGSASPDSLPEGRRARKSGPILYRVSDEKPRVLEDPKIKEVSWRTRARYANIMYDSAFKLVFGSKANKALLIQLLESSLCICSMRRSWLE